MTTDHEPQTTSQAEVVRRHFQESAQVKQQAADVLADPAAEVARRIAAALGTGHMMLICGNGGSAADAQHFAGEMVGRFKLPNRAALPVLALTTDTSVLTCVANDFSYEEVFSRQVEAFAGPGDVVLGLSTSGRSPNVLRALEAGQARGAITVALVGGDGGPIGALVDLALVVPSTDTTRIQECHLTLIHAICELIEAELGERRMIVEETAEALVIVGQGYRLQIDRQHPLAELAVGARAIATLHLASGVDTMDGPDEETQLGPPTLHHTPDRAVVTWVGQSARWLRKQVELHAWADGFSYGYTLEGHGTIDRAHLVRTRWVPSPAHAVRLFNPEPNSGNVLYSGERCTPDKHCVMCNPARVPERIYTGPADFMTISVGRDKDYHDGNWFFTPAPFCYAVEGDGGWLGLGVAAEPGAWQFSEFQYPGDGFGFSLVYDGHTAVNGTWHSPRLVALVAPDEYEAVERTCAWLRAAGLAPDQGRGPIQPWWREPIFCGWGEQVSQEVNEGGLKAPARATQANYEHWLATLAAHDVHPGTVVLDDKWQRAYGLNNVDMEKWPDLPGFIAGQHRQGRHVLLWLKAWDPEGVPPGECICDPAGQPVAVDPGHPAFRERLAAQVQFMLRELDADGFKIDFTHIIPRGRGLHSVGGAWGLELLRQWLAIIAEAARAAKPDALVMTHTANPYLADLVDMLRLNDVAGLMDPQTSIVADMRHRVRVARAASPWWLIDADNWPCSTREQWRDYIQAQAGGELGVPSLYHAERLGWGPSNDALAEEDYAAIRTAWATYRARLAGSARP